MPAFEPLQSASRKFFQTLVCLDSKLLHGGFQKGLGKNIDLPSYSGSDISEIRMECNGQIGRDGPGEGRSDDDRDRLSSQAWEEVPNIPPPLTSVASRTDLPLEGGGVGGGGGNRE